MLFKRHTQTPEEELQQEDRRAIEDQFDVFLSEVSECVVTEVIMDEVTGAQLIAEALKSQVCCCRMLLFWVLKAFPAYFEIVLQREFLSKTFFI